ncbi:TPA: hypothetical protein I7141_19060 [Vibrio vulnificus]|uniref:Uncharacterized protein n=1 Tax=Vibrio campbellii TaxID=680 RepID=A0ABY5IL67_9VIBR|nr:MULTISPECIES: hypothetical protein [Vibrio harveyi group]NEU19221.1 hypothetical protein [Vibrio parahaemolyticus]UTZ35033.1 hypothetical protein HB762_27605 [Vibrio campbellii]UTZ35123.1 hypothetical protein HB762_28080 [Vibrio campbellii]HAS6077979.1 hypothetical protein [Vibrio vulnificus]
MNATFEESMLNDCLVQLQEQFPKYSKLDQMKILESIRSLVVEPKTITKARPLEDVLADIREAIEDGGRARTFFTTAFSNWYRRTETPRIAHLHDYVNLDYKNRHLFQEMMGLRDSGRFDDEALYQFEQYCLSFLDKE